MSLLFGGECDVLAVESSSVEAEIKERTGYPCRTQAEQDLADMIRIFA